MVEQSNSHKVTIKRVYKNSPLATVKDDEVERWHDSSVRAKGTRKSGPVDKSIYTGLDYQIRSLLVGELIELPEERSKRREAIKMFYDDLYCFIPAKGLELEIGLRNPNKAVGESFTNSEGEEEVNLPIDILDYIRFKALFEDDPRVAKNELECRENPLYEYYIVDTIAEYKEKEKKQKLVDKATSLYMEIHEDSSKMTKIVRILKLKPQENTEYSRKMVIREFIEKTPQRFIDLISNPQFDVIYMLSRLLYYNIVNQGVAGIYFDSHDSTKLANNEKEMIQWLNNPDNSEKVSDYKKSLQMKTVG